MQICLKNPKTRELFTDIEKYENIDYEGISVRKPYKIVFLKDTDTEVELFFNGEKVAVLKDRRTDVEIKCNGIFEIKNDSNLTAGVTVECSEKNIVINTKNREFNQGIGVLCEVNVHR